MVLINKQMYEPNISGMAELSETNENRNTDK